MSIRASSSSSAEQTEAVRAFESVRPGDLVAGFRLQRLIGRGETGAVYEAIQISLGRAVALRLIDPSRCAGSGATARLDRELSLASSLNHPGLVPVFEAGEWAGGRFVAMRLVRGGSLSSYASATHPSRAAEVLAPIAAGLEAAHRAELSHGAVRAENVLVSRDGRALLADLGLGRGRGPEADYDGLEELRNAFGGQRRLRRRRRALAVVVAVGIAVAVAVALLPGGGSTRQPAHTEEPAPRAPAGTVPLASGLEPGATERLDCGSGFGGASSCRLLPADTGGTALQVRQPGVVRAWAVRGASGELTLEVLRREGAAIQRAGFSQPVAVSDPGPHRFPAEIAVARGDLIAVRLSPGATMGRRRGSGTTLRLAGALLPLPARPPAGRVRGELLLRVDIEPGARPPASAQIAGPRARAVPQGTTLGRTTLAIRAGRAFEVRLVRTADGIQLDSLDGRRRIARLPVPDADPAGELVLFEQICGHPRSVCLRWQNPGEATTLLRELRVTPRGGFRVIG